MKPLETRQRSAFLLWPKTIAGQTRWLRRARWEEHLVAVAYNLAWNTVRWLPVRWLPEERKP